ncbi:hypothetical protein MKW94_011433 [Papaver nudicaule]|uniref:Pectinesterase n=1 Tax=Papaver nudicaule TaxID=74823 RepID=A0AA41S6S1_PAPNU|nr:hypothetical protein [Papaver nudicaule]
MTTIRSVLSIINKRPIGAGVDITGEVIGGAPNWATSGQRKILQAGPGLVKPNVVVALDGSGKYRSVNEALQEVPADNKKPFIIYVKQGVYYEWINVTQRMTNLVLIGDGATKTKISHNQGYTVTRQTYVTATFGVDAVGFIAKDIGFENSAGPAKFQAVALRVSSDMCIFYRVRVDGYQDSLFAHRGRQFYRECTISGTIDFIFGDAVALFQRCNIIVRKPMQGQSNMVLASGKNRKTDPSALILQNCRIQAHPLLFPVRFTIKSYLGRPWKKYATHIVMFTQIDDLIDLAGWHPWDNTSFGLDTCFFAEFNNSGLGASLRKRANWAGVKTRKLPPIYFNKFTATSALMEGRQFIKDSGIPYTQGLTV